MIPAASTGNAPISSREVIKTDQANRGTRSIISAFVRMFSTVTAKLMEAAIEEAPARCRERMAISTAALAWAVFAERGGYTVQPVAAPPSQRKDESKKNSAGGSSQNLRLLRRGNAISGAEIMRGISQFPNPPIKTGITRKKIIRKACAVTTALYACSPSNIPGKASSARIRILKEVPSSPLQIPKIK